MSFLGELCLYVMEIIPEAHLCQACVRLVLWAQTAFDYQAESLQTSFTQQNGNRPVICAVSQCHLYLHTHHPSFAGTHSIRAHMGCGTLALRQQYAALFSIHPVCWYISHNTVDKAFSILFCSALPDYNMVYNLQFGSIQDWSVIFYLLCCIVLALSIPLNSFHFSLVLMSVQFCSTLLI